MARTLRRIAASLGTGTLLAGLSAGLAGGGCLQILGDEGPFVLGSGGAGASGGSAGTSASGAAAGAAGTAGASGAGMTDCTPPMTEDCYTGPDGTKDVGNCKGGTRTCDAKGTWGACDGEVTPKAEDPTVAGDEACDGFAPGEALCAAIFGDADEQMATEVYMDPVTGAMLVAGRFNSAIAFGKTTLSSHGYHDMFVAKLAPDCTPIWATQIGGPEEEYATGLTADSAGNVYVAGWSYGTVEIGAFTVPKATFIARLNVDTGEPEWAKGCAGDTPSAPNGVTIDQDGDVVVAGFFQGTLNCGDGAHTSPGGSQTFVTKLKSANGAVAWTKAFTSSQSVSANAVTTDSSNNIIVVGSFAGSVNFGQNNLIANGIDAFILKLTASGSSYASSRFGEEMNQYPYGVAIGAQGSVLIAGQYQGTIKMPGVGNLVNSDYPHSFIIKQLAGGGFVWGRDTSGGKGDTARAVVADSIGNAVVGINFEGDLTALGTTFTNKLSAGRADGLVLKVNGDTGDLVWARQLGDAPVESVTVGPGDAIASCGMVSASFSDTVDFGTGPLDPQESDAFILRSAP